MAYDLPRLDAFVPPLSYTPRKRVEPKPRKYDTLSDEERAVVDRQVEMDLRQQALAEQPRSALGEIGVAAQRGALVELPRMAGQALKAVSSEGSGPYLAGRNLVGNAEAREVNYARDLNEGAHGAVTEAFVGGAEMLAPSLAPLAALPLLTAAGAPAAVGLGGAALLGGATFGAAQFQDTYEKAIAAGKTPEEAKQLGLATGAVEGVGETIGTFVGGKFVTGAGRVLPRVLGRKYGVDEALSGVRDPRFLKQFAKELSSTAAVEVGTEATQAASQTAIERAGGISDESPWDAATHTLGPTLALTALLGPLGALGVRSRQRRNQALLETIESPDTGYRTTWNAMRELAPQIEPLVGKEATANWRLDVLERANDLEFANVEDGLRALEAKEQAQQPVPSQLGVSQNKPQYANADDAQAVWDSFASRIEPLNLAIAAEKSEAQQEELFRQLVQSPLPPGVPSFSSFVTQVRKAEGEPANAAQHSARGLKLAYIQRVNAALAARAQEAQGVTPAEAAQPQLDLAHSNADPRVEVPREPAPGPTVMQQALARAQSTLDFPKAEQQRAATVEAAKAADLDRLGQVAQTTRRVEAANKLADDALAGKINGNTPVAYDDLRRVWSEAANEFGLDVSVLRGQNLARVENAIRQSTKQKLWVNQLASLQRARDAMKEGTVSRDSIDALIQKVKSYGKQTAAVPEETGQGTAEAVRGNEGQTPPVRENEELLKSNVAAPGTESVSATPPAPAKAPVAATPVETIFGPTRAEARSADGTTAASSNRKGVISSLEEKVARYQREKRTQLEKAKRAAVVPEVSQRPATELQRYSFEQYHYDSKLGPQQGTNNIWLLDYAQAQEDALGFARNRKGELTGKRTQASMMKAQNAREALKWLWDYEGLFDWKADELSQLREAIANTNTRMRDQARAYQDKVEDAVRYEYKRELLRKKLGHEPSPSQLNKVELTSKDEKEIARIAKDDPGLEYLHASEPIFNTNSALASALESGNLNRLLDELVRQAPTEGMRQLASVLRRQSLPVNVRRVHRVETQVDEEGRTRRTYGRYHDQAHAITIFDGGDNVHTVVHELLHAATVNRVDLAIEALKKPAGKRRALEKLAVQQYEEARDLMNSLRALPGAKQHYGLRDGDVKEFIAETFSNAEFQDFLKQHEIDGKSAWQRLWEWVTGLFGADPATNLTAYEQAMSLTMGFMETSRFKAGVGRTYDHSATAAAAQTDSAVSTLVRKYETLAANSSFLGTMGDKLRSGLLQAASTFHIGQWVERTPALKPMHSGVQNYMRADATKNVLRQTKQREFSTVTNALKLALAKLPSAQAKAMNERLMGFAGDMSTLGVDLNKNFDANAKVVRGLDPSLRDYLNRKHAEYTKLPAAFKQPFEESFRVYRKNYIQHTAMVLRDTLGMYADSSPQLKPVIKSLDILDPKLGEGTNPRPDFFQDPYAANLDRVIRKALKDAHATAVGSDHLSEDVAEIDKFYNAALANPYMHLGRSGDYYLEFDVENTPGAWEAVQQAVSSTGKVVGAPTDKRHLFLRFENPAQRDALRKALDGMPSAIRPGSVLNGSLFDSEAMSNMQGVPRFVRGLMRRIDTDFAGDEKAELRSYLKRQYLDALPDSSASKALTQRKDGGVPGFDADFMRNYAKRAEGMASMISNQYTLPAYDAAFDQMKEEVSAMERGDARAADYGNAVLTEMGKRFSNSISPVDSPVVDKAKALGFNYFLAFSPAFWLTNIMQPYHLTLPFIGGRYGFATTAKEMGRSTAKGAKLIRAAVESGWAQGSEVGGLRGALRGVLDLNLPVDKTGLSPAEVEFVRRLVESGQLDTTQGHELGRIASGDSSKVSTAMKVLSAGSHYTEVLNRLTAGLTAFNLANQRSRNPEQATNYGIEAVRSTQYDYSDHNIGRAWGRHGITGKVTPLLTSFQQYSFQTIELMTRLVNDSIRGATPEDKAAARWALGGVMATTSLLAGTLGLPLANVVAAVADRVLGDGDDPMDVKSAYRSWLAGVVGKDLAEGIARGVPRSVLGFDTSGRMGMQDLLPGSRFMADRRELKDKLESGALSLLGPAISAGTSSAVGVSRMLDGQLMDGLIEFLPFALKGLAKAVKMEDEGYTTQTGNRLPIEVTPWGSLVQSLGFTPSPKAEQSEANFALRQRDSLLKQRKALLANKLYRAIEGGEDATALMQEVMLFNSQNPQYRIDTAAGLAARAKARATASYSDAGIATLPRYLPLLDRYNYANVR